MLARGFLFLSISIASQVSALDLQRFCFVAIQKYKDVVYKEDLEKIPKTITLKNGRILEVEKYIASGRPAAVGILKKKSRQGFTLVVKKSRESRYEKEIQEEWGFFEKNAADVSARMVPIFERAQTEDGGSILIKPYVEGSTLQSLVINRTLNERQLRGLQKLFAWSEDFYDRSGIALDINPFNLVWVDEPEAMAAARLSEPSFIFYELTPSGSKLDTFAYRKLLAKLRSYQKPEDAQIEDFPEPVLETEEAF